MVKASAAFDIIPALVTLGRVEMPGVHIVNGYGSTEAPDEFVLIGAADPFSNSPAVAIEADQEFAYANTTTRHERGHINCVAYVGNGNGDADAAWTRLQAILDPLAALCRTNYTLGLDDVLWVALSVTQADQDQGEQGAWALANFRIYFQARI